MKTKICSKCKEEKEIYNFRFRSGTKKYRNICKECEKLCHYSNLQLLKAEDNLKKGDKLNWKLQKID